MIFWSEARIKQVDRWLESENKNNISHQYINKVLNSSQLCDEILKMDNKIRAVAIYDEGKCYHKMQDGLKSYLTQDETKNSLAQAVYRWASRKKMAPKIGQPIYSMAKYERIYSVTIPVGKAGLILVSTELNSNLEEIVEKIRDKKIDHDGIIQKNLWRVSSRIYLDPLTQTLNIFG